MFLLLFILCAVSPAAAQQVEKLDPVLREVMRPATRARILARAVVNPLSPPGTQPFGGSLALQRSSALAEPVLGVFLTITGPAALAEVRALGGEVGSVVDRYATARVPLSALDALARSPAITRIEAAHALRLEDDSSGRAIHVDGLRTLVNGEWQGAAGQGAIVGLYDTGLDLQHQDFIDASGKTRVLGVWDQTTGGTPPEGFVGGSYCTPESVQQAVDSNGTAGCREKDTIGHGTHVAGIAAGDGSAPGPNPDQFRYAGVAPRADLLVVNGGPGVFFEDKIVDGLTWLRQEGLRLNRPVVANLSLGGEFGAHDGSRTYERIIDALSGPGFIVVISAGNNGVNNNTTPLLPGQLIHARGTPTGTATLQFQIIISPYTAGASHCDGTYFELSFWYDALDSLTLTLQRPSGSTATAVRGGLTTDQNAAGRIRIDNGSGGTNPENGDVEGAVDVSGCDTSGVPEAGTWTLRVTPAHGGSGRPYDMWLYGSAGLVVEGGQGFDNRFVVGSPGTAKRAITVGAFVTRLCWPSVATTGQVCYTQREALGDLARFSAAGPTRDGRMKPEITAPGLGVISSHSHDASLAATRIAPDGAHAAREGTSMSAPQVTGAVAVLLSANHELTPEDVKGALAGSAAHDAFTSNTYDVVPGGKAGDWWGWGKLDVQAALLALSDGQPSPLAVTAAAAVPSQPTLGGRGARLPLLQLNLESQGFEPIALTAIGFDVKGTDPGARLLLVRDNGDGKPGTGDIAVDSLLLPLTGGTQRAVFHPDSLRASPFLVTPVFLEVELSGQAVNGATFEATLVPAELHSRGVNSGAIDLLSSPVAVVASGPASTTVLRSQELLSLSENPVRHAFVVFNFAESPGTAAVYTVTGRRVIDLCATQAVQCGATLGATYTRWDLRNDHSELVAPGVYLLIFTVNGQTFRQKLIVLTPAALFTGTTGAAVMNRSRGIARSILRGRAAALAALTACLIPVSRVAAQGAGTTGATVLQLLAGGRAAALSGAYVGATGDADVLFYNPAGAASLLGAFSFSYQQHVENIGVASGAGAVRVGRLVVGASAIYLDYGSVQELVPDPDFGGQTGVPTGNTVSASEVAARLSAALPFNDGRFHLGASAGWVSTDLAGTGRGTPFLDVGAQYALSSLTLGAALRNIGGSLSGDGIADAALPKEARVGGMLQLARPTGMGAILSADLVAPFSGGGAGLLAGVEAGLLPGASSRVGAVARVGYNGAAGSGGQGAILFGGGVTLGPIAVDYAYQNYELFGVLHCVGIRWSRR